MKNVNLTGDEWEAIYTCVYREYKRQLAKSVRHKTLSDISCSRWLNLLKKVAAHIEMDDKSQE